MTTAGPRYIYGPVPSRRLGHSLGLDLVPYKTCTYDCIYCQLGRTTRKTAARQTYFPIEAILSELKDKLANGPPPDYITLAGSGEPTLNTGIGELIAGIKTLTPIPVAVLTNGSLLWQPQVQDSLMEADLVIPSLDAGDEQLFRRVNRPHREITFARLIAGLAEFSRRFPKPVWLEVFLLAGITGMLAEVEKIAALARQIKVERVQLNTTSRPPAEEFAYPVGAEQMRFFATLFAGQAEVITASSQKESPAPVSSAVTDADILALLKRRPCTMQDVAEGLGLQVNDAAKRLQTLIEQGTVVSVRQAGALFYEAAGTDYQGKIVPGS